MIPKIDATSIHIWWMHWDTLEDASISWEILSPQERDKAMRFKRPQDRQRYGLVRGTLRKQLAHYLQQDPSQIQIIYGPYGKPCLSPGNKQPTLCFNVSHSGQIALFGFRLNHEIGVDVEQIQMDVHIDRIARRFFLPQEYQWLQHQADGTKRHLFFALWTRKEACIKATGESLFEQIGRREVPLLVTDFDHWMSVTDQSLFVRDLDIHGGYRAAIASVQPATNLVCREWTRHV